MGQYCCWADFLGAICPRGNYVGDKSSESQFSSGAISRGIMSGGNYLWGNCLGAIIQGQLSSVAIVRGAIVWGEIFLGGNCPRGQLSGGQLSGGQFSSRAIVRTPDSLYKIQTTFQNYPFRLNFFFKKMTDKNNKINDEKRFQFKEEFAQQEKNISNLISENFSITKQQIEEVKKEVLDLRKNIEFTENQLEKKVNNAESKLAYIEHRIEEIYDYQIDLEYIEQKLIDLEDRLRRNNLRVDGILETPGETW